MSWPTEPPKMDSNESLVSYLKNLRAYCYVFENTFSQLPPGGANTAIIFTERTTTLESIMLHVGDDIGVAIDHARNTHRKEVVTSLSTERRLLFDIFRKIRNRVSSQTAKDSGNQLFGNSKVPIKSEIARLADKRMAHRPEKSLRKQIKRRNISRRKKRQRWIYIGLSGLLMVSLAAILLRLNNDRFRLEKKSIYKGNHISVIDLRRESGGISIKLQYKKPKILTFPETELADPNKFEIQWYADNAEITSPEALNALFLPSKYIPKHTKKLHVVVTPISRAAEGPTVMSEKLDL